MPWHSPPRPPVAPDRAHELPVLDLDDEADVATEVAPLPVDTCGRAITALAIAAWALLAFVVAMVWPW
jgi:hypothetical protein